MCPRAAGMHPRVGQFLFILLFFFLFGGEGQKWSEVNRN
jgi:hypothetical protein